MQQPKEEIRQKILVAAKKEFLEKGFEKASIRTISTKAEISKSNLYNYFKNKDDLFCQTVSDTMNSIKKATEDYKNAYKKNISQGYTLQGQSQITVVIMTFIYQRKDDFILLLFKSQGSSYENFKDIIKIEYLKVMNAWLKEQNNNNKVSPFFVECIADFYINAISQLILKEKTAEEAKEHFKEFLPFIYGGWNTLLSSK
jgi:AcrR family transcriptional regulator